jgi:hypothetical protein
MVLILLLAFLSADVYPQVNSWHGIIPMHSTRGDVEKLLGPPTPDSKAQDAADYRTENERVFVLYSTGSCDINPSNGWNVPRGTVITVSVYPNTKPKFSTLKIDESKYQKNADPEMLDLVYYTNDEEGISIEVNIAEGVVNAFRYWPTAKEDCLRCPRSSTN